ncbi:MAG TPA: DUF169 domain-containing protein [Acidimicrobiia bacterium]|nr:DUF169 domain-containing protein [Acidimicrobiia bacterium]
MSARFEDQARALRSLLQLSAPPIAISFHASPPVDVERFDRPMPAPTADGRTGRVPAGCVFWMHATERAFATVAEDHANCSVGSYTHGFVSLETAATHGDVAAIVEAGWVAETDFPTIPAIKDTPGAVTYEPLPDAKYADVVLVRVHSAGLMTLLDAWPELMIEGKPQCHIVAIAQQHGRVAASVGCALSRARTGMPATEATAAIPVAVLDSLIERLTRAANANATVARYAGADAARFEEVGT